SRPGLRASRTRSTATPTPGSAVADPAPLAAIGHDAGVLECPQVEGAPGLAGPERVGQVADALLAASQESDSPEAGGVTTCSEAALRPPEVSRAGRGHAPQYINCSRSGKWPPATPATARRRRLREEQPAAWRPVDDDRDLRLASDPLGDAAGAGPVEPAHRRGRHRDEVGGPGLGLDEDLAHRVPEAHDPLEGEASQTRLDPLQIAPACRL